ncbi:unnamed protein product (macronuclear) [Paramecium tetraurelia]|uniref:Uncharacterized protein n=1 Tax=Paramecium tetraurelia TaxID=5888 RepID=A0DR75_PARTE|nr:uncharacterized protein GSPATT00019259001 [Paramecium tetraurelia]CAK85542.1 unnamed protein product [Paramecium tetraurelia]|eukprot:XP_001452939.1 hypothetical protein (macronuclear) [Paramecium tetraurelia strain d4-2]
MGAVTIVVFGVVLALFFKLASDLDVFKPVTNYNEYGNCKYLKEDIRGPEDMTQYNSTTIIIGSGNFQKVYAQGKPELEQQGIYAILNSNKKNYSVLQLEVKNFPKDVALYMHGIYVRKQQDGNYLFVINHAYHNGGERIEVFKIDEQLVLTYTHSIIMGEQYTGILNDLVVIDDNRFLITTYMPLPDPKQGRSAAGAMHILQTLFYQLTKQKTTYIMDCRFKKENTLIHPVCKQLPNTSGIMRNGITWNKRDLVWVADSVEKGFTEYQIQGDELIFKRFVPVQNGIDNIEYQEERNSLIIGLIPKLYNYFQLDFFVKTNPLDRQTNFEYWGAVGEYDLSKDQLHILTQNRYLLKGLAGGLVSGNNLFLGSWCDVSVMVCQKI